MAILADLTAWIAADDSMEGSLAYEAAGPGTFRIQGSLRFGNSMGQGSVRVLTETTPREIPWVPYSHEQIERVTLCEETGARESAGKCPIHGGDACLRVYGLLAFA